MAVRRGKRRRRVDGSMVGVGEVVVMEEVRVRKRKNGSE